MSNRKNYRRDEARRTENGPRWENRNPGAGCNSTHVARSRRKWKRLAARVERRTSRFFPWWLLRKRSRPEEEEDVGQ